MLWVLSTAGAADCAAATGCVLEVVSEAASTVDWVVSAGRLFAAESVEDAVALSDADVPVLVADALALVFAVAAFVESVADAACVVAALSVEVLVLVFAANAETGSKPTTSTTHRNMLRSRLFIFNFISLHLPPASRRMLCISVAQENPPAGQPPNSSFRFRSAAEYHAEGFRF